MKELIKKYGQAVQYLPPRLREDAMKLKEEDKAVCFEFRLRAGREPAVSISGTECPFSPSAVRREELQTVLELATKSSVHSSQSSLREGFVTVTGGHRIGICGTAIRDKNGINGFRELSSVSIRIAKEIKDAAEDIYGQVISDCGFCNTLIISPPGHGKTTTLRDLVRRLSDSKFRISLVDERGEIAAKHRGVPQFDVGRRTDIIDGTDKANGAMLMLRTMTPDIIALDEITAEVDVNAVAAIVNCGVGILATAHGESADELFCRPIYKRLNDLRIFRKIILLKKDGENFGYTVSEVGV